MGKAASFETLTPLCCLIRTAVETSDNWCRLGARRDWLSKSASESPGQRAVGGESSRAGNSAIASWIMSLSFMLGDGARRRPSCVSMSCCCCFLGQNAASVEDISAVVAEVNFPAANR